MVALHHRCSNNQAEQLAIVQALEAIKITYQKNNPKTVTLNTYIRITFQSLKNTTKSQFPYRKNYEKSNST